MINRFRIIILGGTLFLSAFLLFVCQPMAGKMLLPYLGGAAAVWTTCVLFFQFMLLLGYLYAHLLSRVEDTRKQMIIHVLVLMLPLAFLPIRFGTVSSEALSLHPSFGLLLLLMASAAVPFFVISTTAPLVQSWFSRSRHEASHDPYFLYSASNAGSLLALMAYPFFVEPRFGVIAQTRLWAGGYIALLFLLLLTVGLLKGSPPQLRRGGAPKARARQGEASINGRRGGAGQEIESVDQHHPSLGSAEALPSSAEEGSPGFRLKLFWLSAAFIPSALMLAVTNHIAENIGSMPFLWIIPLALYLLTFILAFAHRFRVSSARVSRMIPVVLLGIFPLVAAEVVAPPGLNWLVIGLHLLLLYCGALLCHTKLADSRPDAQHLTEFYFWIALGGVLGGVFTATFAPLLFNTVLEYPLVVACLPFFRTGRLARSPSSRSASAAARSLSSRSASAAARSLSYRSKFAFPVVFGVAIVATWLLFRFTHLDSDTNAVALAHTALLFVAYKQKDHVRRFAWSFAILITAYAFILPGYIEGASRLYAARNFFGVKKVVDDRTAHLRKFLHGDTIHGIESTEADRAGLPLSYYYPGGSVSDVVETLRARNKPQHFGVLGLGTGTMASYADSTHHVTFFEIDPSVEPIARHFFTFLAQCGSSCDVVIGDGRLQLERTADLNFDLLLLDAFSSDSVPTHLLSREAVHLYLRKLTPDGILMFHVSNRYLNVEKLVSSLVSDSGLVAYSRFDDAGSLRNVGKTSANHVVAARHREDLAAFENRRGWNRLVPPSDFQAWTDDYSNLLSLIRWH